MHQDHVEDQKVTGPVIGGQPPATELLAKAHVVVGDRPGCEFGTVAQAIRPGPRAIVAVLADGIDVGGEIVAGQFVLPMGSFEDDQSAEVPVDVSQRGPRRAQLVGTPAHEDEVTMRCGAHAGLDQTYPREVEVAHFLAEEGAVEADHRAVGGVQEVLQRTVVAGDVGGLQAEGRAGHENGVVDRVIGTDQAMFGELPAEFEACGQDFVADEVAGQVEVAVLVEAFVRGGDVARDGDGVCAEIVGPTQFADCPGSVLEDLTPGNEGRGSGFCRGDHSSDVLLMQDSAVG